MPYSPPPHLNELADEIRQVRPPTGAYSTGVRVWVKEGAVSFALDKPAALTYLARLKEGKPMEFMEGITKTRVTVVRLADGLGYEGVQIQTCWRIYQRKPFQKRFLMPVTYAWERTPVQVAENFRKALRPEGKLEE